MSRWNKISVAKFQEIDKINARKDLPDIDKLLFSTCLVFNMTEHDLDNTDPQIAVKLTGAVEKIFSSEFKSRARKRIGLYRIRYDVSKMTFGQFIELSFFLGNNPTQNAHYIMATISCGLFKKGDHSKKAAYFLKQKIESVVGCISMIAERFEAFRKEYSSLFGIDEEVSGKEAVTDKFNKRYGWIYSASQVAEYERITLDQAFALPVRQALNGLAYLKAKTRYESEQLKRSSQNK